MSNFDSVNTLQTDRNWHNWFCAASKTGSSSTLCANAFLSTEKANTVDHSTTAVAVNSGRSLKSSKKTSRKMLIFSLWLPGCSLDLGYSPVPDVHATMSHTSCNTEKKARQIFTLSNKIRCDKYNIQDYVSLFLSLCSLQLIPRYFHTSLVASPPTWKLSTADGMSALPRASPSRELSAYSTLTKSKGENRNMCFFCVFKQIKVTWKKGKEMKKGPYFFNFFYFIIILFAYN